MKHNKVKQITWSRYLFQIPHLYSKEKGKENQIIQYSKYSKEKGKENQIIQYSKYSKEKGKENQIVQLTEC